MSGGSPCAATGHPFAPDPVWSMLRHHRLIPRVTLVWAAVAAALLLWHPDLGRPRARGVDQPAQPGPSTPCCPWCLSVFTLADGWGEWATWVGLSVVWVFAEVNLGWRRSLAAFIAGHLTATVVVAHASRPSAVLSGLASVAIVGIPEAAARPTGS